jgi:hypothetical protein
MSINGIAEFIADLPVGQFCKTSVQPFSQKYFASRFGRHSITDSTVPPSQEGRIAIVTDVGRGMRWTLSVRKTNAAKVDGEVVWS